MLTRTPPTAIAAVLLALLTTLLPATPVEAQTVQRYQNQARVVTNDKREAHDLVKLRSGKCVQRFARRQARRMANRDRMFHQDLGRVLNRCNLSRVGENVAYGYPTGRRVVRAWMRSEGHRANILDRRYRLLGMAMRRSDDGTPYAAQVFGRR
ncbi:MAG: CAP domain-containing protein [Nocardioides sp.]